MSNEPIEPCGEPVDIGEWNYGPRPAPFCTLPSGHTLQEGPCRNEGTNQKAGDPCRFCGKTLTDYVCDDCVIKVPDNMADIKALFARGGFSLDHK